MPENSFKNYLTFTLEYLKNAFHKSVRKYLKFGCITATAQPRNRATAQPRNRATAQPRNRATAQPRNRATAQPRNRATAQ
jgi:hypothetical protein